MKLTLTAVTVALMIAAGKRYYPVNVDVHVISFAIALSVSTWSILSIGFLIASLVPTARFAQPIVVGILYSMLALSGLFVPLESLPPALHAAARALTLTYAVSLLQGFGKAIRGRRTWATWWLWSSYFRFSRHSQPRCFAGNSACRQGYRQVARAHSSELWPNRVTDHDYRFQLARLLRHDDRTQASGRI